MTDVSAHREPPTSDVVPPSCQARAVHCADSVLPLNSSPIVGWSWTSPSGPTSVSPAHVPVRVPAPNSDVRESINADAGVVKLAAVAGAVAEVPALSADVT